MSPTRRPKKRTVVRRASRTTPPEPEQEPVHERSESPLGSLFDSISGLTTDLTSSALKLATRTRDTAARAIARTPEQLRMMASAGESLRDIREVAGMTRIELSDALNLRDKGFWEAVEDGREVLSFELILRLASLLARNDPIPFVLKYTRSYHPRVWEILHDLKIDQLPLQFERERNFMNIYRRHDNARKLSDEGFDRVLKFTQQAFDMAIHFVAEVENAPAGDEESAGQHDEGKPHRGARKRRVTRSRR